MCKRFERLKKKKGPLDEQDEVECVKRKRPFKYTKLFSVHQLDKK